MKGLAERNDLFRNEASWEKLETEVEEQKEQKTKSSISMTKRFKLFMSN